MIHAAHALNQDVRRIFLGQVLLVALVCAACLVFGRTADALAALYGGVVAVVGGWLAYRSAVRATPGALSIAALYGGLTLRLTAMVALFAIAFGVLELTPLPLLAGFVVAQLASSVAHFTGHRERLTWHKSTQ
jgi:F0F1-type ATP synthase assembly protein I